MSRQSTTAACQCGQCAIEVAGAPIVSAICCCESCRTAGLQFEQAPGAPPVVRADGGVEYSIYRKDRVRIARGGEQLQEHRLTPRSPTRRVVARCCNTPMFVDFTKGHWLTLYRARLPAEAAPTQIRTMAKDAPAGVSFADGTPTYRTFPPGLMVKLLATWAAMWFRRPKITW
jgi:hypothetical protein